jgi:hypothetical protein
MSSEEEEEDFHPIYLLSEASHCLFPCTTPKPNNCVCAICYKPNSCMINFCSENHSICVFCAATMFLNKKLNKCICTRRYSYQLTQEIYDWMRENQPSSLDFNMELLGKTFFAEEEPEEQEEEPEEQEEDNQERIQERQNIINVFFERERERINDRLLEREENFKKVWLTLLYNYLLNNVGISENTLETIIIGNNANLLVTSSSFYSVYKYTALLLSYNIPSHHDTIYFYITVVAFLRFFIFCDFYNYRRFRPQMRGGRMQNRRSRKHSQRSSKNNQRSSKHSQRSSKHSQSMKQHKKNIFKIYPFLKHYNFTLNEATDLQDKMTESIIKLSKYPENKLEKHLKKYIPKNSNRKDLEKKTLNNKQQELFFKNPDYKEKMKEAIIFYKDLIIQFANTIP